VHAPAAEVLGVNSRIELAAAEQILQNRLRHKFMESGVTLYDPATTMLSADTQIAPDVAVGSHVVFGIGVVVESGVEILPFSHLEGVRIKTGARIGPFARLRPGTVIGQGAHIGNFVEIKKAQIDAGVKIGHLSYIGDAHVGAHTNIGAGTITCNYDGFHKHATHIGADVFVGSNTALVAPVNVGDGAMIAAGSVINQNVPAGSLSIARARQENKDGWAGRFRGKKR
jgi:bifunctional UDP-N-acetylglucosamine pyrophosphorylase/glucosamine-1-phosphate N-acetyltransferase